MNGEDSGMVGLDRETPSVAADEGELQLADLDGEVAESREVLLINCRVGLNGEAPSAVAGDGLD